MFKWYWRRRAAKQLTTITPDQAAQILRLIISADVRMEPGVMLLVVQRAIEGATGPGKTILEKYADAYQNGRRVKFGTGYALLEGETPEMISDVESAFASSKENES